MNIEHRKALEEKEKKMRTMTKRFYIGSTSVTNGIESNGSHPIVNILSETIAEAKRRIANNDCDVLYIVEIVKIVRRKPVECPIIVEDVK
jgi:hypothetical protein